MKVGIDPGLTGAIALLDGDTVIRIWDMPTMEKTHGKGNQVNPYILCDIFREIIEIAGDDRVQVFVERVGARPGMGVTGAFSFGRSAGVIEGAAAAYGLAMRYPTPQRWKKGAGLIGKPKDSSRTLAIEMYPEVRDMLTRKKDNGRSDAILIAANGGG